jgi:hypothetical protein
LVGSGIVAELLTQIGIQRLQSRRIFLAAGHSEQACHDSGESDECYLFHRRWFLKSEYKK